MLPGWHQWEESWEPKIIDVVRSGQWLTGKAKEQDRWAISEKPTRNCRRRGLRCHVERYRVARRHQSDLFAVTQLASMISTE
jgi:hypothetical protein